MKKVFSVFLVLSFFLCGCQTVKTASGSVVSPLHGFGKDVVGVIKAIGKADKWFRENCW